jgi:hypothetical protein
MQTTTLNLAIPLSREKTQNSAKALRTTAAYILSMDGDILANRQAIRDVKPYVRLNERSHLYRHKDNTTANHQTVQQIQFTQHEYSSSVTINLTVYGPGFLAVSKHLKYAKKYNKALHHNLRLISGVEWKEVTGERTTIHNQGLRNL